MGKNTVLKRAKAARATQERVQRTAPLGSGSRFKALENSIAQSNKVPGRKNIQDPGALAAFIGRRKFGKANFQKMSARGRQKS